jgi:branched-chain amino acid transport system permease protein
LAHFDAHQFWQAVANGISLGCLIGLLAVGYSLVYGVAKLINFAHGDIFTLGGYYLLFFLSGTRSDSSRNALVFIVMTAGVAGFALGRRFQHRSTHFLGAALGALLGAAVGFAFIGRHLSILFAVLAAIVLIAVAGVAFEYLVYRPLEGAPRLSYLVAAIGLSISLQGLMQLLFGTDRRAFPTDINSQLSGLRVPRLLDGYFSGLDIVIIGFTVVVTIMLHWLAKNSTIGIAIRASADDPVLATRLGLNVRLAKVQVFALGSALAAVCAFFFVARQRVLEPTLGFSQGIVAFAAAVIGGIGRLTGALLGGLFIGMILSILPLFDTEPLTRHLPEKWVEFLPSLNLSDWGLGIVYLLMALVFISKPRGLLSEQTWRDV